MFQAQSERQRDPDAEFEFHGGAAKPVDLSCPQLLAMSTTSATDLSRAIGLSQALRILHEEGTYLISPSLDDLWRSYSLEDRVSTEAKRYLIQTNWFSGQGKWGSMGGEEINKQHFVVRGEDDSELQPFMFFSRLFNAILECFRQRGVYTSVKTMVHTGPVEPESTSLRPDAFLHVATGASPTWGKFRWRDVTCPFEYKLDNGDAIGVSRPEPITCRDSVLIITTE